MMNKIILFFKGMAMGVADLVPGVSGGTIAFIMGIYEEFINALAGFNLNTFKRLWKADFKGAWKAINGGFLFVLLSGIFLSLVLFSKLIHYLLLNEQVRLWSFFFGLVFASVWMLLKSIEGWSWQGIISLLIAMAFAYYLTTMPPLSNAYDGYVFIFLSAALAVCALILPGISGAFILVLLGSYGTILKAIKSIDIPVLIIVFLGALMGILSFSKVLKYLFRHYKNTTLAVLTGFIIGSLNKIWPWKKVLSWRVNAKGVHVPLLEKSILPQDYEGDAHLIDALLLFGFAVAVIGIIDRFSKNKK